MTSAVKTVVIPRHASSAITRTVFTVLKRAYDLVTPASMSFERRDRVLATYAPLGMLGLLVAWIGLTFLGYAAIFWGLDGGTSATVAIELSGSSLLTLGFLRPSTFWLMMVSFTEAAIGLFLLALLITYLPSINGAFSRREQGVTALSVRAGEPPSGVEMVLRFWRLERMSELHEVWVEWERWFVDVEETHTSFSALAFFRSPADRPLVGDGGGRGARRGGADDLDDRRAPRRAGRHLHPGGLPVAAAHRRGVRHPVRPRARARRPDLDHEAGMGGRDRRPGRRPASAIRADRDRAWRDFAGWRVNYDTVLLELADLTDAPYAMWSSDRGVLHPATRRA